MANKKQQYDWIDDPFNEQKSEEELRRAEQSRNRGCLLVVVCFIVVIAIAVGTVALSFLDLVG